MRTDVVLGTLALAAAVLALAAPAQGQVGEDLNLTDLEHDQLVPGETTTFTATVHNDGAGDETQPFNVTIRVIEDDVLVIREQVDGLASDQNVTVSGTWEAHTGTFTVNASLENATDDDLSTEEPGNNFRERVVQVPGPDLVADKLNVQPSSPVEGEDVELAGTVSNVAEDYDVSENVALEFRILDDGTEVFSSTKVVEGIRETTTKRRLSDAWTAEPGSYTARLEVDADGNVSEVSETNNTIERAFSVQAAQPDLAVTDVRPTKDNPQANESTPIEAVIENQGNANVTTDFDTRFKINGTTFGPDVTTSLSDPFEPGERLVIESGESWLTQKGHHDLTAIADPGNATGDDEIQTEASEDNNELTRELHVGPDLVVDGLVWTPDPAVDGHPVNFKPRVLNQGTAAVAENTTVHLEIPDEVQHSAEIGPLGPGNTTQIDIGSWTPPEDDETYQVTVTADHENEADEVDEANNRLEKPIDPEPPKPDLVATSVATNPNGPHPGDDTTIEATIDNRGSDAVEQDFEVRFLVDGEQVGQDHTVEASQVDPFEPDDDPITVTSESFQPSLDNHTVTVRVDPADNVDEVLETNNDRSLEIVVGPDARVQDVTWTPVDAEAGDQITFDVTVENVGTVGIETLPVRVHVDDAPIGNATAESLDPGENATVSVTWEATRGDHTVRAVADPDGSVDEARETNNEREESFSTTASPDLQATSLSYASNPQAGDQVVFTAQVANTGEANVKGSFEVRFAIDGEPIGTSTLQGLDAGQSKSVSSDSWTAEQGSHTIEVTVDHEDRANEGDETNNVRSDTVVVEAAPPPSEDEDQPEEANLVVSGVTVPEEISPGDGVTFLATIENTGGTKAPASEVRFLLDDNSLGQRSIGALEPGQSASVTSEEWTAKEGEHTLTAIADAGEDVQEADEGDNERLENIRVGQPPADEEDDEASLQLSIELPSEIQAGDAVRLSANLANGGDDTARNLTVTFFVDGSQLGQTRVPAVTSGGQVSVQGPIWNATEGEHRITARAAGTQAELTVEVTAADEAEGLPAPGLALAAGALAAAALAARRE